MVCQIVEHALNQVSQQKRNKSSGETYQCLSGSKEEQAVDDTICGRVVRKDLAGGIKVKRNRHNQQEAQSMTPNVASLIAERKQRRMYTLRLFLVEPISLENVRVDPPRYRQLLVCNELSLPRGLDGALDRLLQLVLCILHILHSTLCTVQLAIEARLRPGLKVQQELFENVDTGGDLSGERVLGLERVLVLRLENLDDGAGPSLSLSKDSTTDAAAPVAHGLKRAPCPLDSFVELQVAVLFELVEPSFELRDEQVHLYDQRVAVSGLRSVGRQNKTKQSSKLFSSSSL